MKELFVTGNAGGDPIKRTTKDGKEFITFSVAHYEGKTSSGETKPSTWVEVVVSADSASAEYVLNNLKKGYKVLVKGRNRINAYMTKQGQPAASETMYANHIEVFSPKSESDPNIASNSNHSGLDAPVVDTIADHVPF